MDALSELKQCIRERKFTKNYLRSNIGPTRKVNGWQRLVEPVFSNTIMTGRILELCQNILGEHINCVCLNRNVHCAPHRDGKNDSHNSFFLMFGDFAGGELCIDEPEGFRILDKKNVWYTFNGKRDLHWNKPILEGTKYSLVCFVRNDIVLSLIHI